MSTRSIVAVKNEDGSYDSIYCHFDGYIEGGVGSALHEHHDSFELARALIEGGDHSTIAGGCETYLSRGEDWSDVKPQHHYTLSALTETVSGSWAEYLHMFIDGMWVHKEI